MGCIRLYPSLYSNDARIHESVGSATTTTAGKGMKELMFVGVQLHSDQQETVSVVA